jgi:oxygen-dependent protoporphyrinogen oxidase
MRIIVVGGGISGLTAAYFALAAGHEVVCVEPERPGGLVASHRIDGFLCEAGPQAVLDGAPDTAALVEALGLAGRAIHPEPGARRRFIFVKGKLRPIPMSPLGLLTTGTLSFKARLRVLLEPLMFARQALPDDDDETFLSFGRRRLGAEAARVLLATAAIGIYAGDAAELSVASAFPRLAVMERDHGSLFRGFVASRGGGRSRGRPLTFPEGLGELPAALARALGPNLWRAAATGVAPSSARTWRVDLAPGPGAGPAGGPPRSQDPAATEGGLPTHVEGDIVLFATDAPTSARLLGPLCPEVDHLNEIVHAPIAVCALGFRDVASRPIGMKTAGYGFLVARGEKARLLGCQFESSTFAGRAPDGAFLARTLLGGVGPGFDPAIVEQPEDTIASRAVEDLRALAGLSREPDLVKVWRYARGIPQYRPGHMKLVKTINEGLRKRRGLYLIGHALRGVGLNECIRAAQEVVNAAIAAASHGDSRKSAALPTFAGSFPAGLSTEPNEG